MSLYMSLCARRHWLGTGRFVLLLAPPLLLLGCSGAPKVPLSSVETTTPSAKTAKAPSNVPALPPAGSGRGGYYMDDGPGDDPPPGLLDTPDAEPKLEPYTTRGNKPYVVFGKTYTPFTDDRPFKQRGIGSWYGKKFHGQKTSSGEPYDMYKMTAAHPTLPIPSYARVTNVNNGKQVIVRVNDRGPFHSGRIIDLSYTAALKLGYLGKGSGELEVERLLPADIARLNSGKREQSPVSAPATSVPAPSVSTTPAVPATSATPATPAAQAVMPVAVVATAVNLGGPEAPRALEEMPAVEVAPAPASAKPVVQGFYLQLGAYGQRANADAARSRLLGTGAPALPPAEVVENGGLFRLYTGPFATREEAATVASRLQESGNFKPMIVQR